MVITGGSDEKLKLVEEQCLGAGNFSDADILSLSTSLTLSRCRSVSIDPIYLIPMHSFPSDPSSTKTSSNLLQTCCKD